MACKTCAQEAIWLRRMPKDIQEISLLHKPADLPSSPIYMDNQSAMALTRNAEYQKRTKHIDISYHFARECVASGEISVAYVPADDMTADVLTKALPVAKHQKHIKAMGLVEMDDFERVGTLS